MAVNKLIKKFYPEAQLLGYTFVDGTMSFYNAVNKLLGSNAMDKTLLDLGCGRGWYMFEEKNADENIVKQLRNYKGRVKKVIGIDVDQNAATNPALDEFRLMEIDKKWPLEDSSIDICICDYVMEHVNNVHFFFSELNRVMKKEGVVCFRTPNKFGYVSIISSLIPNAWHAKVLKKAQPNREEKDIFPVVYNCNTKKKFFRFFKEYGFDAFVYHYEAEPNYLKFSYVTFLFGFYFNKALPRGLKNTLFAFGIKK